MRSRGGGNDNVPLTSVQLAQVRDGGGGGVPGGAVDGVWAAATRRRDRTMAAELTATAAALFSASVCTEGGRRKE
jgi:hypothetical protein